MRLLYVVPYAPSPIRVRPWELLRALAGAGHEVVLATLYGREEERVGLERLAALGIEVIAEPLSRTRSIANCLAALPTGDPMQSRFCWQPRLWRRIATRLETTPPEGVWVEHLRGARYGEALLARRQSLDADWPVVWDSVDCISHLFSQTRTQARTLRGRLMAAVDLARTRRYEGRQAVRFDRVVVTSPADHEAMVSLGHGAFAPSHVAVLPNGVDLERFAEAPHPRPAGRLIFTGKLSYHANDAAACYLLESIMPRVWARCPEAELTLAGAGPGRRLLALAARSSGRVQVTGQVEDLAPLLAEAAVAVAPLLYGTGIQNKVLEAMACATPVVATPLAAAALKAAPGEDLVVADGAEALATRSVELLQSPEAAAAIGRAGRRYVERRHRWPEISGECVVLLGERRGGAATLPQREGSSRGISV